MFRYLSISLVFMVMLAFTGVLAAERIEYPFKRTDSQMDMGQDFLNIHKFNSRHKQSEKGYANGQNYSEILNDRIEIRMVWIPSGAFWMGIGEKTKTKTHEQWLKPVKMTRSFYIQETEVSQLQWNSVIGKSSLNVEKSMYVSRDVSWLETIVFCNRLSIQKGLEPCYFSDPTCSKVIDDFNPSKVDRVYWKQSANGYRLPTEAEWEYAAWLKSQDNPDSTQIDTPSWEWCWESDFFGQIFNAKENGHTLLQTSSEDGKLYFRLARFAEE
ncbi:SUMF1/EgtB/PvdO family nonheme iron enzyme [bacterium]|nr:SUMF1/EgtB/PvdO family nonheme iron enzyme [candidate division CSSED10-310 bacterium]